MYTAFYGLREKPFALSPDPRFLYLAESHREALAHLLYGIDQGEGFIAVTGEVGTGKTTLCRTLLERLGSETAVAFLFNPSHSAQELLEAIAAEFELAVTRGTRRELGDALNAFLLDQKREGRRVLLIVDEAQNLSSETLEQLRLLSNLETASQKLIQILLLGQPELDAKLDSPELRQLRQRIGVRWSLLSLQSAETREYVRHRLRVAAGAEREIFSESALREIHRRSGGVPRLVNVLCDRSLLSGYAEKRHDIDARLVRRVAEEIPDTRRASRVGWLRPRLRFATAAWSAALVVVAGVLAAGLYWGPGAAPGVVPMAAAAPGAVALPEVSSQPPAAISVPDLPTAVLQPPAAGPPRVAGSFGTLLEQLEPSASRLRALNGVLAAYAEPAYADAPVSDLELRALLAGRGLSVLALPDADFDTLRTLNHPALLSVRTPRGGQRTVALVKLAPGAATVFGVRLGGVVEVPPEELARDWNGRAFVVWRDFEAVPELLVAGASGGAVEWLQGALAELGVYAGPPSGRYDEATLRGVRALQVGRRLVPDGAVGPRTKMVIYDLSKRYEVPRLIAGDASG